MDKLAKAIKELIRVTATRLPIDVEQVLISICEDIERSNELAQHICLAIKKNIAIAKEQNLPLCQDTGIPMFFIEVGKDPTIVHSIIQSMNIAIPALVNEGILRPNAVHPITNVNTGNCMGNYIPWMHIEYTDRNDYIAIVKLYLAGGGSSLPAFSRVYTPAEGLSKALEDIVEVLITKGVNACPPLFLGIGIGPTAEIAAVLSKKALLRKVGSRHSDEFIAKLEERLRSILNELGIGFQGLGVGPSVIDVFIEYAHRHPATYAVALSVSCWALRRGELVIYDKDHFEIISHGLVLG